MADKRRSADSSILALCLICTFFWGAGYPVVKMSCAFFGIGSTDVAGKLLHAGCRFLLSGLGLMAFFAIRSRKPPVPGRAEVPRIIRLGLCQTVLQYGLLYVGLALTTGAKGAVLNQVNVFLMAVLTPLFFRSERLTLRKLAGCAVGFAGMIVMNLQGLSFRPQIGDGIVVLSSCCAAVGYFLAKAMPPTSDPVLCTAWQQAFGGCVLLVAGMLSGGRITQVNFSAVLSLLFLVLASAAAYSVWFYLLQRYDASRISIYKFLTPIFGVLLSGLLLHEQVFTVTNMAALLLVCIGIAISGLNLPHQALKKKEEKRAAH